MALPQFLRAVRALSARYVERRAELGRRPAVDSAGKRAAFAGFYAPLHFYTTREIVRALGLGAPGPHAPARHLETIIDLGCGTGAAGAAWALELTSPVSLVGIDTDAWALTEAGRTWRTLGLTGRTRRGRLGQAVHRLGRATGRRMADTALVLGWSVNELPASERADLLSNLIDLSSRGATVLVIEPLATRAVPWWPEWRARFRSAGGRGDEWRFDVVLPEWLRQLDEAAGFRRDGLTARSLLAPAPGA